MQIITCTLVAMLLISMVALLGVIIVGAVWLIKALLEDM